MENQQNQPAAPSVAGPVTEKRSRAGLWWSLGWAGLAAALALGWFSMENPLETLRDGLIFLGETQVRPSPTQENDYLVFLRENTPAIREQMLAAAAGVTYVGESLFPGVVVVQMPQDTKTALAALQQQTFVRMVLKYNPAFGCH